MNNYDNNSHPYDDNDCVKEKKSDDASSIILILGILSIISMFTRFFPFIGLVLAIVALVKGTSIRHNSNIAMVGWVLSIISVCLFAFGVVLIIGFMIPPLWRFM